MCDRGTEGVGREGGKEGREGGREGGKEGSEGRREGWEGVSMANK